MGFEPTNRGTIEAPWLSFFECQHEDWGMEGRVFWPVLFPFLKHAFSHEMRSLVRLIMASSTWLSVPVSPQAPLVLVLT